MAHIKPCIEDFNATYGSTEVFEARIQASELAFENCLKNPQNTVYQTIFALSLLRHTKRMALGYAWDYYYKNPQIYGKKITKDRFTLSIADLHLGKIVFVPY